MNNERGYRGTVIMESPAGERRTIRVPGRIMTDYDPITGRRSDKKHITLITSWMREEERALRMRQDRVLQRFLSAGWKVIPSTIISGDVVSEAGQEDTKETDLVIGTTLDGDQSHGGDHASGEVKDSPNRAQRGCRGGRSLQSKNDRKAGQKQQATIKQEELYSVSRQGGSGIYSPQPIIIKPETLESTRQSAELLKKIIGQSDTKMPQGVKVDAEKLLVALETGDNLIPSLETQHEVPRLRVIVSPDYSDSTQSWSGIGKGWASHIARMPEVDVAYIENFNGEFVWHNYGKVPPSIDAFLREADMLIYLGDGDGYNLCQSYATQGARVIALDCHCASVAKPKIQERSQKSSGGELTWIYRVSAKDPMTWFKALELVLSK